MKRRPRLADGAIIDARRPGVGRLAAGAERPEQLSLRREFVDGVVQVVGQVDGIVRPDPNPVRPDEKPRSPGNEGIAVRGQKPATGWSPRLKTKTRSRESVATAVTSETCQSAGHWAQSLSAW